MSFLPLATDLFSPGVVLLGAVVIPGAVGMVLRRWAALGVVFVLWVGLMLSAAAVGWLEGTDDVSTGGLIEASVVLILIPAEAVTVGGILLGRSTRKVPVANQPPDERS